ncbi:MAG: FAD-dependent oxidoreductase [Lachnospiraceae bacterium]|nr:FAD-dependent oxidoreductase [Lachnospiraceae bacterium]
MYDIIVIGGGPAGLTAAIYARRANKSVVVIEKDSFGGQITFSPKVENIPGFTEISGNEFAERLVDQAISQEVEFESATVEKAAVIEDPARGDALHGRYFLVTTEDGEFEGKTLIIATGAKHRMLGLPGDEEFVGDGVSFCAVCDGAFYRDQNVGLVGGGNSALQEAVLLAGLVRKLTIFQDLPYLTGEVKLQEELKRHDNVEVITGVRVVSYLPGDSFSGITIEKSATGEKKDYPLDGLFVAIGLVPQNELFKDLIKLDARGYADSDESTLTMTPGVFVAGDCRAKRIRQVATDSADGAVAALRAADYLEGRA